MHYVDEGSGDPIVLLHGNPTSSYLWRNIIPNLATKGRVVAVDMIGMGMSGKPDIGYRFDDHATYFTAFMNRLNLRNVTLILHDWGGAVGLDFAANNPDRIKAIAFMEALVRPMTSGDSNFVERYMFDQFRGDRSGQELLIEQNYFIEQALSMFAGRALTETEMAAYRTPYLIAEDRLPVAQWPKEIPIDGTPRDNAITLQENYDWLRGADVPTLLIAATPGAIIKAPMVQSLQQDIPRLDVAQIGAGLHYIQETAPHRISAALNAWLN
jgi:haloalkane dehalogenase